MKRPIPRSFPLTASAPSHGVPGTLPHGTEHPTAPAQMKVAQLDALGMGSQAATVPCLH